MSRQTPTVYPTPPSSTWAALRIRPNNQTPFGGGASERGLFVASIATASRRKASSSVIGLGGMAFFQKANGAARRRRALDMPHLKRHRKLDQEVDHERQRKRRAPQSTTARHEGNSMSPPPLQTISGRYKAARGDVMHDFRRGSQARAFDHGGVTYIRRSRFHAEPV